MGDIYIYILDILVRAKLPRISQGSGECKGCGAKRCAVCKILKNTTTFENKNGKQYSIRSEGELNCSSKCVVYLVTCKTCKIQYVGSTDPPFRLRVNNYKACYRKYISSKSVPQASFHAHFAQEDHNGMDDWEFTLIDQSTNLPSVRRREIFWQYELNTFHPDGLNERDVPIDYG